MTGLSLAVAEQFSGKWLELLKEAAPQEPREPQQRFVVEGDAGAGAQGWADTPVRHFSSSSCATQKTSTRLSPRSFVTAPKG